MSASEPDSVPPAADRLHGRQRWWLDRSIRAKGLIVIAIPLIALLGTALVASCDEWHQTFLPNRTGSPWDVLLDCTGAIVLQLIVYVFMRTFKPKRLARAA